MNVLILKTEHQFNTSVQGSSYLSHVGNSKNDFVMTIVMWIRVHPYKATHFENRISILHFIAFMVLHKDSHHNVIGLPNLFQNTGDPMIVLVVQINNIIAFFTILFVLIVLGKFLQTPQVLCD